MSHRARPRQLRDRNDRDKFETKSFETFCLDKFDMQSATRRQNKKKRITRDKRDIFGETEKLWDYG